MLHSEHLRQLAQRDSINVFDKWSRWKRSFLLSFIQIHASSHLIAFARRLSVYTDANQDCCCFILIIFFWLETESEKINWNSSFARSFSISIVLIDWSTWKNMLNNDDLFAHLSKTVMREDTYSVWVLQNESIPSKAKKVEEDEEEEYDKTGTSSVIHFSNEVIKRWWVCNH